ncbi:hypothetical protein EST38_g5031 [Candolleomyces aberdarensis]|uniref:Nephrocystin 3-like N-terminal domain-containing protein n=1 Tax=Candolleomyces aberdarensis TaxID=2316362 RepID=A0A4Q2DNB7_9AGAR|nr:hypothetical protein EST38_g5031 [Candolleomyces aberdarensis]
MNVLQASQNTQIQNLVAYQVEGGLHQNALTINAGQRPLFDILQPIVDASHTRDRKRSPPDSACFPGTRLQVVKNVNTWARGDITTLDSEPHVRWMHGYVGSGKSSISQEVCDTSEREDRPVISFFFFRNAGDRSKIWRLATTLANQIASVIPQTDPLIRAAVNDNPALVRPDEGGISLRVRMQRLVYAPFKAAVQGGTTTGVLTQGPFLMVLDGLDECDNKDEVQELIDGMLAFFNENPFIPLRVFITSRVEEHIHSRLHVPGVILDNLVDHCSDNDIATFLHILFEDGCRRNSVVRAYTQQHGEWPTPKDRRRLVEHIGGSFIFASAVFKFIMATNTERSHPVTPMDRLPLALEMNPGLDGLYAQTLSRSRHLPRFSDIISTIALLETPLPTSGIADLLGIHTYEVVNVLVNLQAIIQVPGTDDVPVTLCHTSLRDFLTTQSRSCGFFALPSHHVRLFLRCLECKLKHLRQNPALFIDSCERIPVAAYYALTYSVNHLGLGQGCLKPLESISAILLCREALAIQPSNPSLIIALGSVVKHRASRTGSLTDFDEAISLYHEALKLRPLSHPHRSNSLNNLGAALAERHRRTGAIADLENAVSLYCEALKLRPYPHPERSISLNSLGNAFLDRHRRTGTMADLEEAISLHREALELRPSPHPGRSMSLNNLGNSLLHRYRRTGMIADLEEAIPLYREALELRPSPHPNRSLSLNNLGNALLNRHRRAGTIDDLEESISMYREALELRPLPHPDRPQSLNNLGNALLDRHQRTGIIDDLEESISMHREALALRPLSHSNRSLSLNNLGSALQTLYRRTGAMADLQEAISLLREALELRPSPHPSRPFSLSDLGNALLDCFLRTGITPDLQDAISLLREALELQPSPHPFSSTTLKNLIMSLQAMYKGTRTLSHLQEAIVHCDELLTSYYLVGHQNRAEWLLKKAALLQMRFDAAGQEEDLAKLATLKEEADQLSWYSAA